MTAKEAIGRITILMVQCGMLMPKEWQEEVAKDKDLETAIRLAQKALEKQEPVKASSSGNCPSCGTSLKYSAGHKYCHNCGQKLDFE